MLDATRLTDVVASSVGDGVHLAVLLGEDGTVLCTASSSPSAEATSNSNNNDDNNNNNSSSSRTSYNSGGGGATSDVGDDVCAHVVAAVSNMWRAYAHNDLCVNKLTLTPEPHALEQVLVDLGTAQSPMRVCALAVADCAVLCVVSRGTAALSMGLLKVKAAALQQHVDALLRPILATTS